MTPARPLSRLEKLADKNYGPVPKEEFFGGDFSQHEAFIAGGKALLQILSEPGEACGHSFTPYLDELDALAADSIAHNHSNMGSGILRDRLFDNHDTLLKLARKGTELPQARAALETEKRKRETEYQQAAEMHHDICAERDAAKAALASSEARVRILTLLCEGKDELLMAYRTGSAPRESTFKKIEKANQALLEVQR